MSKPALKPEYRLLESELIQTAQSGLQRYRPDLDYPESYSDMQACVRAIMQRFELTFRGYDEVIEEKAALSAAPKESVD